MKKDDFLQLYRWENWGPKRLSDLLKIRWAVNFGEWFCLQGVLLITDCVSILCRLPEAYSQILYLHLFLNQANPYLWDWSLHHSSGLKGSHHFSGSYWFHITFPPRSTKDHQLTLHISKVSTPVNLPFNLYSSCVQFVFLTFTAWAISLIDYPSTIIIALFAFLLLFSFKLGEN